MENKLSILKTDQISLNALLKGLRESDPQYVDVKGVRVNLYEAAANLIENMTKEEAKQPNKNTRYPRQFYSGKREQIVLGIDNYLSIPNKTDDVPPLEMHSPFSRFIATIIDKSGPKINTPKANIPAKEVDGIVKIGDAAMINKMRYSNDDSYNNEKAEASSAYTQVIHLGHFKGKTPAMVLLDDPKSKDELLKTRGFFQENVDRYPQNQKVIDAINDAIALSDAGLLKEDDVVQVKSGVQTIYTVSHKYMADTNAQGHRLFYGMTIECHFGNNYPWVVTIENFFAPGKQNAKGGLTPVTSEKSGYCRGIIRLNDIEWSLMITRMESSLRNFEAMYYGRLYKEAMEIDAAQREARKAAQFENENKAA